MKMAKDIQKKLNINLRLENSDKETHRLIKRLMNFQTDTQVVYYMYGQFRKYLGQNSEYITDLREARNALDNLETLNKKVDQLTYELNVLKKNE